MNRFIFAMLLLAGIVSARSQVVRYVHDFTGRLIEAHYPGNQRITYLYDAAGNVLARRSASALDTDSDGLDDAWEQSFFSSLTQGPTGDADADGFNNLSEFLAGTNPADPNSLLRITSQRTAGTVRIEWPSVSGKRYQAQFKDDLNNPQWNDLPSGAVTASGDLTSVSDPATTPKRFYRIVLLLN